MFKILANDGREYGPVPADTVRQWVREGRANAQTQVQAVGAGTWVALVTVPELAAALGAAPPQWPVQSRPQTNALAVIGFISSLVSITIGLCCCYGLPFNIVGVVLSGIALAQIRRDPSRYAGRGFALAGLIIGLFSFVLVAVLLALGVALSWEDIQRDLNQL